MSEQPDLYDLTGLKCPLPVLKTRNRMRTMAEGEQLWVRTTDPLSVIDMPHFCTENGHTLLQTVDEENGHRFLIQHGGQQDG
ncbi:MAG: sulfurtransferase TusA family protein [Pseudomonadota bacterium]